MADNPHVSELATVAELMERYGVGANAIWSTIRDHELDRFRVPGRRKTTHVRRDAFDRVWNTGRIIVPRPAAQGPRGGQGQVGAAA